MAWRAWVDGAEQWDGWRRCARFFPLEDVMMIDRAIRTDRRSDELDRERVSHHSLGSARKDRHSRGEEAQRTESQDSPFLPRSAIELRFVGPSLFSSRPNRRPIRKAEPCVGLVGRTKRRARMSRCGPLVAFLYENTVAVVLV